MKIPTFFRVCCLFVIASIAQAEQSPTLVFPQNRAAFYSSEPIELAVAGLPAAQNATIDFIPAKQGVGPLSVQVSGNGATSVVSLPPFALAPSAYDVKLNGAAAGKLTVSAGVVNSSFLISQTAGKPDKGGANFLVSNAFGYGIFEKGLASSDPQGKRSVGMGAFERAISEDLPSVVYMYWTGYVTHKPFGSEKSWANAEMNDAMRLLSFHTAQRLRRYSKNIHAVGTLDEPGLSWGKTPAGGMASGFPNWDEKPWYAKRGWNYTDDIGNESDADWMKYMSIRCAIMGDCNAQAKADLRSVWPDFTFATDIYAPQAIMDGTDPMNQRVNDIPTSHVFLDWGIGREGAMSAIYLEKCHDPTSKMAHAMNGQLMQEAVGQPNQSDAYRVMLGSMFAAGLHSNWWLNPTAMKEPDLAAINEPAKRVGPLFEEMSPAGHDVALLWSFTEHAMRQKEVAKKKATQQKGEQIKLMIAAAPEGSPVADKDMPADAYMVGQNYMLQVLHAHQSLSRAGYPTHIVHERLLPGGALKNYKTLVIIGQTFDLPDDVKKAIAEFVAAGGKIVVDGTSTVKFDGAIATASDFFYPALRWGIPFGKAVEKKDTSFKNPKERSYFTTNHFMDEMALAAVPGMKAAMAKTASKPAIITDTVHLMAERHVGGEGSLYIVLNANDELPQIPDDKKYGLYNFAPLHATFTLKGIAPESAVYCIEGADWGKASKLDHFDQPQAVDFAAGETKLYLVAPRAPQGVDAKVAIKENQLFVEASLNGVKMPWPLTISVKNAAGAEVYHVYRATSVDGKFAEAFPLGSNNAGGRYTVTVESPIAGLRAEAGADFAPQPAISTPIASAARVFDGEAISKFLATKPEVVIAVGADANKPIAEKLAADLSAKGIKATVKPESQVFHKVAYPRVWNPFATVYSVAGATEKPLPAEAKVATNIDLSTDAEGKVVAKTSDGKDVSADWKQPESLVTINGNTGVLDWLNSDHEIVYEPGVKIYITKQRQPTVILGDSKSVATTPEFRAKWAKAWTTLQPYHGGYQLVPQLPEAYAVDTHLILLGDSATGGELTRALQASELLQQVADAKYPGPGKSLVSFAWSPFAVEKNVIFVGACDEKGLTAGAEQLVQLAKP